MMSADYVASSMRARSVRHGHVFNPPSRAYLLWLEGGMDAGQLNQREAGKFFPALHPGLPDPYASTDNPNAAPPPDGKIASANQGNAAALDEPGTHWPKHDVVSAQKLDVEWGYSAAHVTRRWNYFITREDWDPEHVLSRAQFEAEPFYTDEYKLQPFSSHNDALTPPNPTVHQVPLPEREGYHVMLAVWEVANTGNAFYHVVDLDFIPADGRPHAPRGLAASDVTGQRVVLSWRASGGETPIGQYLIFRDGLEVGRVNAPALTWTDNSVAINSQYRYTVQAIATDGRVSSSSTPLRVPTPDANGQFPPPTRPSSLHVMNVMPTSIALMWGPSSSAVGISHYKVFRDTVVVANIPAPSTAFTDTGLQPSTRYYYQVFAEDHDGRPSPNAILAVSTIDGPPLATPWQLGGTYVVGDIVSHTGTNWRCTISHTAHDPNWAPGVSGSESLWAPYNE